MFYNIISKLKFPDKHIYQIIKVISIQKRTFLFKLFLDLYDFQQNCPLLRCEKDDFIYCSN